MKGHLDMHESLSCEAARALWEKMVLEEPLSPEELESFNAHIHACERCGNAFKLTQALPELAGMAAEGDYDADIALVLHSLQNERLQKQKQIRWVASLAAAALIAVAVFLGKFLVFDDGNGASRLVAAGSECIATAPVEPVPGVLVTHCLGNQVNTRVVENGILQVSLNDGTVALSVDPARSNPKQVAVVTPDGEVRVKGTLFAVYADEYATSRVEVFRGIVEVIPNEQVEKTFDVAGGYGARIEARQLYALTEKETNVLISAFGKGDLQTADDTQDAKADMADDDSSRKGKLGISGSGNKLSGNRAIHKRTASLEKAAENHSMDALIEQARSCLLSHDWQCAAAKYNSVIKKYSKLPESNAVLISLAKIELRHLGRPNKALNHYGVYLQRMPNGPLAEEALLGMAKSYRQMKQNDKERKVLQRFVNRYPNSALLQKVQNRLQELN